jgi:hypothetical protein
LCLLQKHHYLLGDLICHAHKAYTLLSKLIFLLSRAHGGARGRRRQCYHVMGLYLSGSGSRPSARQVAEDITLTYAALEEQWVVEAELVPTPVREAGGEGRRAHPCWLGFG